MFLMLVLDSHCLQSCYKSQLYILLGFRRLDIISCAFLYLVVSLAVFGLRSICVYFLQVSDFLCSTPWTTI